MSAGVVKARFVRKCFIMAVSGVALAVSFSSAVLAQPPATPEAAAVLWLSIVDGADYLKSWNRAGDLLKAQFTAHDLQSKIAPVREPLGAILARKLFAVNLSNTMPGLPGGQYAVVQFKSRFANEAAAIETVALEKEDNRWMAIGYFIK